MRGLLRSGILLAVALGWGASAVSMRAQEPASSPGQARQRWFFDQRLYGLGFLPDDALAKAVAQRDGSALASKRILIRASSSTSRPSITEGQWISFGPEGINSALGELASGRINSLAIDPRNPATLYVAAAGGGVWKSVSRGTNWIPISDRLPSLASGAVAVDPFTGELWHGTGELNFCRDCYYGAGVYRSSDGGSNWTRVNPDNFLSSPTSLIAFDPQRPGTVFIGRSTALWKSSDGGVSWRVVLRGAVMDLAISPADSAIVYAAVGFFSGSAENGVYRSTDGGETWTRLGGGLPPQASMGRIALALAPSSPNVLYALIANASDQKLNGLFRSLDGGNAWSRMATLSEDVLTEAGAGQGAFNLCLAVDPENPAVVYAGGVTLWRSSDFGGSWENLTAAARLPEDPHEIIFEPGNPNTLYLIGDLGVWRSSDRGASFRSLNQSLAITQFQGVGLHPTNPNLAVGGTQDTGTLAYSGGSLWNQARPGDAGAAFYDAANPQVIYTVARRHDLRRSDDGGRTFRQISNGLDPADRIEFYPPFLQHPTQPGTLYLGTHRLWRSRDRGEHWEAISGDLTRGGRISALAISPVSPQTMYAGTSDGLVQVSTDGGASWFRFANPNFPDRYVTSIAADPRGPERMVVAVSGFGSGHVFRSADFGATWEDISRNLPDVPVNAVLLDALSPDTIYIGTDIGVFVMLPDGSWAPLQNGLPNAVVLGLSQNPVTGLLVAATHGRGIFAITTGAPANAVPRFRSVANAAGFEAGPLAPGMVASLFGSNLAASTATAAGVPLPSSLAGVALLVNNVAAPLFFVSPGQINFQVPYEVAAESIVELRLANAAGAAVMQVPWRPASPGIYQNAGRGVILHSGGSLVSESAPAARGEELVMYVSGLGVVAPATASGVPAPLSPLALTPSLPLVRVGGLVAETRFSGLAPGFVGLYQVNFVVPPGAAGQTTVSLVMNGVPSNTVPLHVQP